ncbi:MAG: thiamine-phosphate kinase, partial [Dehalococcoidia bacterium]
PVHPLVKQTYPDDWLDLALNGGEDYQLLFTAQSSLISEVLPQLPEGSALIGEITEGRAGEVVIVGSDGQETAAVPGGWDHYR